VALRIVLGLAAVAVLVSLAHLGLESRRLLAEVRGLQEFAAQASAAPEKLDLTQARERTLALYRSIAGTRRALLPWRGPLDMGVAMRLLPAEAGQIGPLLDFALPATQASVELLQAAEMVRDALGNEGAVPVAVRLTRGLDGGRPHWAAARDALGRTAAARQAIQVDRVTGRLAAARPALDLYDRTIARHPATVEVLLDAPETWRWLAGIGQPRTFHILGQNVDELRATGGFLASAGEITLLDGAIAAMSSGAAADLEDLRRTPVEPPRPLREFMGLGSWRLQDANWWADFPTTAAQAAAFWRPGRLPDGTIAVDDDAMSRLAGAAGPLHLPDVPEPVTGANLSSVIATHVYAGARDFAEGPEIGARKSRFFEQLMGALLPAALDPAPEQRAALGLAMLQALQNKEIRLVLHHPKWSAALREVGWDGHLSAAPGDFLYLVETTVSNTKLARRLQTDLSYTVSFDPNGGVRRAYVRLELRNTFSTSQVPSMYPIFYYGLWWNPVTRREEYPLGRYAGYYRLYLPKGTALVDWSGWDFPPDYTLDESGRAVIGGYAVVDPGQTRRVELEIVPPAAAGASGGTYQLTIPRQPGAPPRRLHVRLEAPAGLQLTAPGATTSQDAAGQRSLDWRTVTAADHTLSAQVQPWRPAGRP
jgi:hypothetical protein